MKWLLLSDIFPFLIFCAWMDPPSPMLVAMAATRFCSFWFHLFKENRPHLINLDYLGMSCMLLVAINVCDKVGCSYCRTYKAFSMAMFTVSACIFIHGLWIQKPASKHIIFMIAAMRHYPTMYSISTLHEHAAYLIASAAAFVLGYFMVEPLNHSCWHWMAALGQGVLLLL